MLVFPALCRIGDSPTEGLILHLNMVHGPSDEFILPLDLGSVYTGQMLHRCNLGKGMRSKWSVQRR